MIFIPKSVEPANFDADVRIPGNALLRLHKSGRPRNLWRKIIQELSLAFNEKCAYSMVYLPVGGTVDHYYSCKDYPHLIYDWSNYRYCLNTINARKKNKDQEILDPCVVQNGWFEVIIPGFLLRVADGMPQEVRPKGESTILLLKLNGQEFIDYRKRCFYDYRQGKISLSYLAFISPLVYEAVLSNGLVQE